MEPAVFLLGVLVGAIGGVALFLPLLVAEKRRNSEGARARREQALAAAVARAALIETRVKDAITSFPPAANTYPAARAWERVRAALAVPRGKQ